jgi:hypothetical protein
MSLSQLIKIKYFIVSDREILKKINNPKIFSTKLKIN